MDVDIKDDREEVSLHRGHWVAVDGEAPLWHKKDVIRDHNWPYILLINKRKKYLVNEKDDLIKYRSDALQRGMNIAQPLENSLVIFIKVHMTFQSGMHI